MNKSLIIAAVIAFMAPVSLILFMNSDRLSAVGSDSGDTRLSGKLLYFYSPS